MQKQPVAYDSYVLDTCKLTMTGKFVAGAITFKGRKKIEVIQWKRRRFSSQREADDFVKAHFTRLGFPGPTSEIELYKLYSNR
jgi:hypothetical protein